MAAAVRITPAGPGEGLLALVAGGDFGRRVTQQLLAEAFPGSRDVAAADLPAAGVRPLRNAPDVGSAAQACCSSRTTRSRPRWPEISRTPVSARCMCNSRPPVSTCRGHDPVLAARSRIAAHACDRTQPAVTGPASGREPA